jgi:hypothetical protein
MVSRQNFYHRHLGSEARRHRHWPSRKIAGNVIETWQTKWSGLPSFCANSIPRHAWLPKKLTLARMLDGAASYFDQATRNTTGVVNKQQFWPKSYLTSLILSLRLSAGFDGKVVPEERAALILGLDARWCTRATF